MNNDNERHEVAAIVEWRRRLHYLACSLCVCVLVIDSENDAAANK